MFLRKYKWRREKDVKRGIYLFLIYLRLKNWACPTNEVFSISEQSKFYKVYHTTQPPQMMDYAIYKYLWSIQKVLSIFKILVLLYKSYK